MAETILGEEIFQTTLPARGATGLAASGFSGGVDFNPRSPHGERLGALEREVRMLTFQPTLPARGATLRALP